MTERIGNSRTPEDNDGLSSQRVEDYRVPPNEENRGDGIIPPPRETAETVKETFEHNELEEKPKRKIAKVALVGVAGLTAVVTAGAAIFGVMKGNEAIDRSIKDTPSASASPFPTTTAETIPTTTTTVETTTTKAEINTYPTTVEGITEKLRLGPSISAHDLPARLIGDLNAMFSSFDDYEKLTPWLGKTAYDEKKGQTVYGVDALIATYRQAIERAYGKSYYSDFIAQEVANAAGQVNMWEHDGLADVKKSAKLLPTSENILLNDPKGKLVSYAFRLETDGVTSYPNKEIALQIGANLSPSSNSFNALSAAPLKIAEIPR